jgi:CRISPR-associated protein Csm3
MKSYILQGVVTIKYRLKLETGLHIGGAKENFEIGGVDNPVIKLSNDLKLGPNWKIPKGAPYIPGSSLKGKIRSLLEWELTEHKGIEGDKKITSVDYMVNLAKKELLKHVQENYKYSDELKQILIEYFDINETDIKAENFKGNTEFNKQEKLKDLINKFKNIAGSPCNCGSCSICKMFGVSDIRVLSKLPPTKLPGPPRVEFSDAYPTEESLKILEEQLGEGIFTELKVENVINRITSESQNLRTNERVPAGVEFEGEITVDIYSSEDVDLLKKLLTGLRLLENSYLGGSGSRGYGKVKFSQITITFKGREYFENGKEPKPLEQLKEENSSTESLLAVNELNQALEQLKEKIKGQP